MNKKIYRGTSDMKTGKQTVIITGPRRGKTELTPGPSQKLRNHSPDGFNWGYGGSGPAQLALAILLDVCGPVRALAMYQNFKGDVVSRMPRASWEITSVEVEYWVADPKRGREYFAAKFDGGKMLYDDKT